MEKKEYRSTLNLPYTSFPMKGNLTVLEPRLLEFWAQEKLYQQLRKKSQGKKQFILHDGPPYANGLIHIGHALNKILKDIVVKYKTMEGFDCPFICGWDCHGLPVEHQLLKELKLTKHDIDILEFRKKARDFALKFVELQKSDFTRLGIISDWANPYLTLHSEYEYWVLTLLQHLSEKGFIFRRRKPVNWCAQCETALAEAEVEYNDKISPSIYVLFPVDTCKNAASSVIKKYPGLQFLVWTTTPWTLISNVAVAVHPAMQYGIYRMQDEYVLFAQALLEKVQELSDQKFVFVQSISGKELNGLTLSHPFLPRTAMVVNAEFVSQLEGSGCVHIAPGHGEEDFSLVDRYNLEIKMPLNEKGVFDDTAGIFSGLKVADANTRVIEELTARRKLLSAHTITHSYPHCWRCKQAIVFRATYQWFLNIDHQHLREELLQVVNNVAWFPASGIERMKAMLLARPDWCLSRQRLWGIPIPAVKCKSCGQITLETTVISRVAEAVRTQGTDCWFSQDIDGFLPPGYVCGSCQGTRFEKENDILDVWFESGASFLAVVAANPVFKHGADMYLEGSDQHRGWFQAALIPSVATTQKSPFQQILTHGFVVDGEGKKMSKSQGNVIAPQAIIKRFGAEVLRLWVAASDYTEDVKISEPILKQLVDMYRKVRNTLRFILGNLSDFIPEAQMIECENLQFIDRFMLSKSSLMAQEVKNEYSKYCFYRAWQKIFNFCNQELSSFYLDILKDRLYTYTSHSPERKSAQTVLYHVLRRLTKLIAPILSFTAEEVFQSYEQWEDKQPSIFLHEFKEDTLAVENDIVEQGEQVLAYRSEVLKELEKNREKGIIGSSLEAVVELTLPLQQYQRIIKHKALLPEVFIVSSVKLIPGEFSVKVSKSEGKKCERCWNRKSDVGKDTSYPEVCLRCAQAIKEGYDDNKKECS